MLGSCHAITGLQAHQTLMTQRAQPPEIARNIVEKISMGPPADAAAHMGMA